MKYYQTLEMNVIILQNEDIITNSESQDNVTGLPEFPEDFYP